MRTVTELPEARATNSSTVVSAMSRPRPTTISRVAVWAISLIRCEDTNTVRPSAASALSRLRIHRTPEASRLRDLLLGPDVTITSDRADVLHVQGLDAEQIGTVAWRARLPVFELTLEQASLEQAFMELTQDSVEYRSADASVATEVAA